MLQEKKNGEENVESAQLPKSIYLVSIEGQFTIVSVKLVGVSKSISFFVYPFLDALTIDLKNLRDKLNYISPLSSKRHSRNYDYDGRRK